MEDAAAVAALANDVDVARFLRDRFPHPYTVAHAVEWLSSVACEDATHFLLEVDGAVAGAIGFIPKDDEQRFVVEIGYWLGRAYWGRGIAVAAVTGLTAEIFRSRDVQRVEARVHSNNPKSMRVLEKAGYVREGVLRRAVVKDGEILDVVVYAQVRA